MSDKSNLKWRPLPYWIYYFCSFWSNVPFPVAALYMAAKFHSFTSIGGRDITVCAKIQDGGRAILDLISVQYFGIPACKTSSVICVPNFVQIRAIVTELWNINEIQNGARRHLEFIIFVLFGQMFYFRWQPATSLQNFIHLRQSAAELLMFVQKSKMAAAAILSYNFLMLDHSRSPFVHLKSPLQISCWSSAYFSRYRNSKISQIWLKMLI